MSNHYRTLIGVLAKSCGVRSYLELGCQNLDTARIVTQIHPCNVTCVDIVRPSEMPPAWGFFHGTTEEFFDRNSATFDLIFIDADHNANAVERDIQCSLYILNPGGLVVVHDTDPSERKYLSPEECGDSWKALDRIPADVVTLPVDHTGVSIIRNPDDRRVYALL